MNIIIGMGGTGCRCSKDNYKIPKPLVNIEGRPMLFWLLDNLKLDYENDIIYIVCMESLDLEFSLLQRLHTEYYQYKFKLITLDFETRGPAETLFIILQNMPQDRLKLKTVSLDCDTIYFTDILSKFRELSAEYNASFYFTDIENKPIYSYLTFKSDPTTNEPVLNKLTNYYDITDVREKIMISNNANTGCYAFSSGNILRKYCIKLLDDAVGTAGEYYTTNIIKQMLLDNHPFQGIQVLSSDFASVATPTQLNAFLTKLKTTDNHPCNNSNTLSNRANLLDTAKNSYGRKMRFCFDLDNTLLSHPLMRDDYSTCEPKYENIELVRELHHAGHYIIIQTARGMKNHNGNIDAIIRDIGSITTDTLKKFQIPYDELVFGKLYADAYIDDLTVQGLMDTNKKIGCALTNDNIPLLKQQIMNNNNSININTSTNPTAASLHELSLIKQIPEPSANPDSNAVNNNHDTNTEAKCELAQKVSLFRCKMGATLNAAQYIPSHQRFNSGGANANNGLPTSTLRSTLALSPQNITKQLKNKGFVNPRSFNTIQELDGLIIKSAPTSLIRGEIFFYETMPDSIKDMFPKLDKIEIGIANGDHHYTRKSNEAKSTNHNSISNTNSTNGPVIHYNNSTISSLVISCINGVTFSHLFTNLCLTPGRFNKLLNCIKRIHSSTSNLTHSNTDNIDIYSNYSNKMLSRYTDNFDLYNHIDTTNASSIHNHEILKSNEILAYLLNYLSDYEKNNRGLFSSVIHGDPVFSNVLLTSDNKIYLIDMRGRLGKLLTLCGDKLYDLAKIYQSLLGYDFILLDKYDYFNNKLHVQSYSNELIIEFKSFVLQNYCNNDNQYFNQLFNDICIITSSLYFSLIPLHNNYQLQVNAFRIASNIIIQIASGN